MGNVQPVLGYDVEQAVMAKIVNAHGKVSGRLVTTEVNFPCRDLFAKCGFRAEADGTWVGGETNQPHRPTLGSSNNQGRNFRMPLHASLSCSEHRAWCMPATCARLSGHSRQPECNLGMTAYRLTRMPLNMVWLQPPA